MFHEMCTQICNPLTETTSPWAGIGQGIVATALSTVFDPVKWKEMITIIPGGGVIA